MSAPVVFALILDAIAVGMIAVGHLVAADAFLLVYGPVVLALAIMVSLVVAGLRHPVAILVVSFGLVLFLISAVTFNLFGLGGII